MTLPINFLNYTLTRVLLKSVRSYSFHNLWINFFFLISQSNSILDFECPMKERSFEPIRGGYFFCNALWINGMGKE
jgi:hypothetical protein